MSDTSSESPIAVFVASGGSLFRESLRSVLDAEAGVAVVGEAASESAAVSEVVRTRPDVAVVDSLVPPRGGAACAGSIVEADPACKVLLLADDPLTGSLVDAFGSGASGYLPMAASLIELLDAIDVVDRGGVVVPHELLGELIRGLVDRRTSDDRARSSLELLTGRERQVLELISDGADNAAIAEALVISPLTARTHVQNVMRKLRVHTRLEAAMFAARQGMRAEPRLLGRPLRRVQ